MPFLQENGSWPFFRYNVGPRGARWVYSFLAANRLSIYIRTKFRSRNFPRGKGLLTRKSSTLLGAALKTFRTRVDGARLEEGRDGGVFRDPSYSKRGGIDLDVYLSAAERRISDEHKLHAPRERINWSSRSSNSQGWFVMLHDVFSPSFPFPLSNSSSLAEFAGFPRSLEFPRVSVSQPLLRGSFIPSLLVRFNFLNVARNAIWRILFLNLTYLPG